MLRMHRIPPTVLLAPERGMGGGSATPYVPSNLDLSPDEIRFMPPLEKIRRAEKLFDEVDAMCSQFGKCRLRWRRYGDIDVDAFYRWWEGCNRWFETVCAALADGMNGRYERWCRTYIASIETYLREYKLLESVPMETPHPVTIAGEHRYDLYREELFGDKHYKRYYYVSGTRRALARAIYSAATCWPTDIVWDGTRAVSTVSKYMHGRMMPGFIPWPLDPQEPVMQSLQRVLGWHFDVKVSNDQVTIAIDFGEGLGVAPK